MRCKVLIVSVLLAFLLLAPMVYSQSAPNPGHPADQVGGGTFNSSYGNFAFPNGLNVSANTSTLFVDGTNSRLGVGTTTPAAKLQVKNDGAAWSEALNIDQNKESWIMNADSAYNYGVKILTGTNTGTNSVLELWGFDRPVLIAQNGGNVGVGTTAPKQKLDVNGTVNVTNVTLYSNCAEGEVLKWSGGVGKCGTDSGTGAGTGNVNGSGVSGRVALWNGTAYLNSSANLLWDFSNSRLGVGATPDNALHVKTSDAYAIKVERTGVGLGYLGGFSAIMAGSVVDMFFEGGQASTGFLLRTRNSGDTAINALGITRDGYVGIGTVSPNESLTVVGNASIDGTTLVVNSSSDRVGVGTATPGAKLDVNGAIWGSGSRPVKIDGTQGTITIQANAGGWVDYLHFLGSAGTDKGGFGAYGTNDALIYLYAGAAYDNPTMVWKDGNVGIGTVSPGSKLDVGGNINASSGSVIFYNDIMPDGATCGNNQILKKTGANDWDCSDYVPGGTGYVNGSGSSGYIARWNSTTSLNNSVVYETGGNVGINSASPGQKLQVDGGSLLVNGGTGASTFNDVMIGGIGGWSVGEAHRLNFVYNTASSPTILGTIETEYTASGQAKMHFRNLFNTAPQTSYVMTLQGNGNVGIGTTSPSQKLEVVGNTTIVDSVSIYGGNYNFMNNPSYPVRLAVGNGTNNISAYFNASMMGLFSDITDNYPTEGGTFGLSGRVVNDTGGTVVQALSAGYLSSKGWYGLRAVYQNATSTRTVYLATNDHAGYFDGNVSVTGNVSVGARILNADGSASAPSYSFANDLDTGMFRVTDNAVSFAVLGSERARIDNTYLRIPTVLIPMNSNAALIMNGYIDDGASAVGVKIGNMNSLDTAGAKIVSFYKDSSGGASSEKASIDKDGSANFSGNVTAAGNISFDGEIMPDGALCSNNQILKKTAANDWDCATDVGGSGSVNGSGSSGYIARWNSTTSLNNSVIYETGGNVGIGTTGPTDVLTIVGNASIDGTTFVVNSSSDRVGVGTATPAIKLEVADTGIVDKEGIRTSRESHSVGMGVDRSGANWGGALYMDGNAIIGFENGGMMIGTTYVDQNAPSNGLIVQGNVGIGTVTVNEALTVVGNMSVDGSTFVVNSSSDKVGIGTTAPNAPLNVIADDTSKKVQKWAYTAGNNDVYNLQLNEIVTAGDVTWTFDQVNDNTAYNNVLVLKQGKVGIGTTSPNSTLNVVGNVNATSGSLIFDNELMPDGANCSAGQILKKTADNDWDCAADAGGSGMSGFTAAGDAGTPQAINNSDTLTIAGGTGITTSAGATDTVTITNSDRGSSQNIFKSISNGSQSAVADLNSDTLTLGGNGITTVSCTNDPDECIIAATEVDGSVTNEAQTLSSSGATPNMQIDLSTAGGAGGGSVTCQTLTGGSGLCDGTDATGILAEDDPYVDTVTNTYVCYGNGASHVECNDNAFYWDTSNKLGIGTTNPASMLHLQGGGIIVNQSTAVQAAPSGTAIYGTGSTFGIYGQYSVGTTNYGYLGSNGRGVYGDGSSYGVYGYGLNIAGIYGTAGTGAGVLGNRSATGISVVNGAGVQGSGSTYGVYGSYNSQNYGFLGNSSTGVSGRGDNYGVYGEGGNFGVYGQAGASTEAVRGQYDADTYGWLGSSTIGAGGAYDASNYGYVGLSSGGNGYGVYGVGGYVGVYGIRGGGGTADSGSGVYGTGSTTGVVGEYSDTLRGYLGSSTYGAYGQYDGNRYGYLGSSVAGAYGKGQYNSNGFLGADNIVSNAGFGVLGNSSGTVGLYNYGVYGKADLTNDYNIGVVGSVDTSTNYFAGTYGIYGRYDSNNYGYLGSNGYGVYGKGGTNGVRGEDATSATRFGYLGSQNYAVYGQYDGDTYGYFASSSVGAYAQVDASNYAYLGYSSYGTYGVGSDSGVVGLRGSATVSWPNVGVYGGYDADTFGFLGGGLTGVVGQGEGNVYGGLGYAAAANANYGAYGYAVNGSNTINYGMYGGANLASSNNIGVLGQANSSSGYAVGVMGYSGTSAAVTLPSYDLAGYFYGMPVVIGTYSANVNATNINGDGDLYVLGEVEIDGLAQATSAYTLYYQQGGRITRTASSRKFKEDIWDYSFDIEKLKKLRPVTFTYNNLSGAPGTKSFGLIAEEVDEVFPELVGHDENGSADTVAYDHIGVTLIKVAQEQQKKIEAQQEEINLLKAENSQRQQELTELKTAIGQIQQQLQTKN
jgi:hypothetical protein